MGNHNPPSNKTNPSVQWYKSEAYPPQLNQPSNFNNHVSTSSFQSCSPSSSFIPPIPSCLFNHPSSHGRRRHWSSTKHWFRRRIHQAREGQRGLCHPLREKEKLMELKKKLAEQHEHLKKLEDHINEISKGQGGEQN